MNPTPRLILASGSTYKRELLERLGYPFESIPADLDETPLPEESPRQVATRLAREKAWHVARQHPEAFVIGADQVISFQDQQLHKPVTAEAARAQLEQLQGQTHALDCAVALITPSQVVHEALASVRMTMRPLDEDTIAAYVEADRPLDCAGSYRLESRGIRLFTAMEGDDYTSIIGLPLTRLQTMLLATGSFAITGS